MAFTIILAIAGCVLLFVMIWEATVTMPFAALAKNFPEDVQDRLRPRIENLPMNTKRVLGIIGLVILMLAWLGLFIVGGMDGKARGFTYWDYAFTAIPMIRKRIA